MESRAIMHKPVRLAALVVLLPLLGAALPSQDEPKPDPALSEKLKELKSCVMDRKMAEEARAIGILRQLADSSQKGVHKTDHRKIVKAVANTFAWGRVRPPDKDVLYREAATALGKMGPDGARALVKTFDSKRIKDKDYVALRGHILLQVGKTQDEKQIDFLTKRARRSHHDPIMAAAGQALGEYTKVDLKTRRTIVKELLIKYGEVDAKARQPDIVETGAPYDFTSQNARRTLAAIQDKWNSTLSKLSGQTFTALPDWQHWQNKNPRWKPPGWNPKK